MTPHVRNSLAALVLPVVLAACAPSTMPTENPQAPERWQEQIVTTPTDNLQAWWQRFNDPSLDRLIATALQSSLDVKQAQARIEQVRAELTAAGAALYPDINANASVARSDSSSNAVATTSGTNRNSSPFTLYRAGFDASWEIDLFGRTRGQIAAAQARHAAAVEDLHDVQVTLLGEVASEYINLRNNQRQRAIAQENIVAQQHALELTQERYRRGLAAYLDVAEAQTQLANTQAILPLYDMQEKQALRTLAVLLGQPPQTMPVMLDDNAIVPSINTVTADGLPSDLLTRRPDLRAEQQRLVAAAADVGVAKTDRYPSLDLTFGLGLQSRDRNNFTDISSRYWSVVPGLQLPVFDAGRIEANIDNKQAVYEEARYHYQQTFHRALQDVENALSAFYAQDARCNSLRSAADAAATAVELSQRRYASGIDDFLNVIVAQRALYTAQSSLAEAEANRSTQAIALYKALGGGWQ